ncbi:hypothetical protein [Pelomonas sp. SE-A7]|uniref:hypothetical protein n=1 Tax=Pelomonas sp. SE-A7 TaxID=3054953 RepID=UPI00259CD0D1|nr:hypothetical protein [Pelomonas sp. SE-A7]MDM4766686.1 hypothetical protein [Pelomonas sp. SE-A7]
MFRTRILPGLALGLVASAWAADDAIPPTPGALKAQPAAFEANWTSLKLPTGDRVTLLGTSYLVAMDEDWGAGPSLYGAARGKMGGLFTMGMTAQRRWQVGQDAHLAVSLYAGAGGGVGSNEVRFGGGLMLRPEVSLRTRFGSWYGGVSVAHTRFPSGNVRGTSTSLVLGTADGFFSFAPTDSGYRASPHRRTGLGIDEVLPTFGSYRPRHSSVGRDGSPTRATVGKAGASLRQYLDEGSWWGVEAAGASTGGNDGYMEVLAALGRDWPFSADRSVRLGWHGAAGLGGGGNLDTGNGWVVKAGPTLRWTSPWGPSLHLEAGLMGAPSGTFKGSYSRLAIGLPLDSKARGDQMFSPSSGTVRSQALFFNYEHLGGVRFRDGRRQGLGLLQVAITQDLASNLYATVRAGSAAWGSAGGYSMGLMGAGVQSNPLAGGKLNVGAGLMIGASGGGGVAVSGGAVAQSEAWAQWRFGEQDRLRLRAGLTQWRSLRGQTQSATGFDIALGYAFGTVSR